MTARHSSPIVTHRRQSQAEREKRQYHSDVRKFKQWCTEHQIAYYTFKEAPPDSICALSMDDYSINVRRSLLEEDHEDYFLHEEYYEEWEEQNIGIS